MKNLKFYKENNIPNYSSWYIDLPKWEGSKADLQMVEGADDLLDYLCDGNDYVILCVSEKPFNGANILTLIAPNLEYGGADYHIDEYDDDHLDLYLWLCDVTKFVFGYFPDKIYIK